MSKETPETKLCKYCKSEIPYDAKVCPHCRKKQTPNGCLIAIIVIVVLFILIGVAGGSSSSSNQNASSSASAIHFDTEELDDGDDKDQRHSFNLKKSRFTNLFLDAEHSGVAGENSWGAWPLEKYRLHYGDKNFTFVLIPLDK